MAGPGLGGQETDTPCGGGQVPGHLHGAGAAGQVLGEAAR